MLDIRFGASAMRRWSVSIEWVTVLQAVHDQGPYSVLLTRLLSAGSMARPGSGLTKLQMTDVHSLLRM